MSDTSEAEGEAPRGRASVGEVARARDGEGRGALRGLQLHRLRAGPGGHSLALHAPLWPDFRHHGGPGEDPPAAVRGRLPAGEAQGAPEVVGPARRARQRLLAAQQTLTRTPDFRCASG